MNSAHKFGECSPKLTSNYSSLILTNTRVLSLSIALAIDTVNVKRDHMTVGLIVVCKYLIYKGY